MERGRGRCHLEKFLDAVVSYSLFIASRLTKATNEYSGVGLEWGRVVLERCLCG